MRFQRLAFFSVALIGVAFMGVLALARGTSDIVEVTNTDIAAGALDLFQATRLSDGRTDVEWRAHSVERSVFSLYREQNGRRQRISPQVKSDATADRSYTWRDQSAPRDGAVEYWLENVDAKGQRKWHGPLVLVAREPRRQ